MTQLLPDLLNIVVKSKRSLLQTAYNQTRGSCKRDAIAVMATCLLLVRPWMRL